jgi:hypothetical protein
MGPHLEERGRIFEKLNIPTKHRINEITENAGPTIIILTPLQVPARAGVVAVHVSGNFLDADRSCRSTHPSPRKVFRKLPERLSIWVSWSRSEDLLIVLALLRQPK